MKQRILKYGEQLVILGLIALLSSVLVMPAIDAILLPVGILFSMFCLALGTLMCAFSEGPVQEAGPG